MAGGVLRLRQGPQARALDGEGGGGGCAAEGDLEALRPVLQQVRRAS
jgi:hypothetical protein